MAKQNKNKNLFTPGGCLSARAIDRYLSSGLSSEERKSVKKHISECEFCAEAIEGYRDTELKEPIYTTIKKLNKKIEFRKRTAHERILIVNRKIIAYSSLAASILILAGLFLLINYLKIEDRNVITETLQKEESKDFKEKASDAMEKPQPQPASESLASVTEKDDISSPEKEIEPAEKQRPMMAAEEIHSAYDKTYIMKSEEELENELVLSDNELLDKIPVTREIDVAETAAPVNYKAARGKGRIKYTKKVELTGGQEYAKEEEQDEGMAGDLIGTAGIDRDKNIEMDMIPPEEAETENFIIVEDMPKFKGGNLDKFKLWVAQNLCYPESAVENEISGKVYIQFTINEKGNLVDAKLVKGVDPALDNEALRVIKSSPKWEPGKQGGEEVKVQFTMPVVFSLQ
jgi:TonB family protein